MKVLNRLLGLPVYEDTSSKLDVTGHCEVVQAMLYVGGKAVGQVRLPVRIGDAITIIGRGSVPITFTAKAAEDLTAREFDQSGTDTQTATSIKDCVNDSIYGVPGVTATSTLGTVSFFRFAR